MIPDISSPLQSVIYQQQSWTRYVKAQESTLARRRPEDVAAAVESIVSFGIALGKTLPFAWRVKFDTTFRPGEKSWNTTEDLEAVRQEVRQLFFTAREAMEATREVAETLRSVTGRTPAGMTKLLEEIEHARQLEESVFRDWPSFRDASLPATPAGSLVVDESLAEALGISVEEARQRLDARRREVDAQRG